MTPSNHLILCRRLLLPSIFLSIRVFSSESAFLIRWSNHWSFLISPSNEYLGLISFSIWTSLVAQTVKRLPTMQQTWVPSLGREDALEKKIGNPLQYSCLENPMDRVVWWDMVHEVTKSWTGLNDFTFTFLSFRIDWFDLFGVQGTLKSFLQHHNLKASILWHSAFFVVQLSHLNVTIGKTIALTTDCCW